MSGKSEVLRMVRNKLDVMDDMFNLILALKQANHERGQIIGDLINECIRNDHEISVLKRNIKRLETRIFLRKVF